MFPSVVTATHTPLWAGWNGLPPTPDNLHLGGSYQLHSSHHFLSTTVMLKKKKLTSLENLPVFSSLHVIRRDPNAATTAVHDRNGHKKKCSVLRGWTRFLRTWLCVNHICIYHPEDISSRCNDNWRALHNIPRWMQATKTTLFQGRRKDFWSGPAHGLY